jgi:hypothetical protein
MISTLLQSRHFVSSCRGQEETCYYSVRECSENELPVILLRHHHHIHLKTTKVSNIPMLKPHTATTLPSPLFGGLCPQMPANFPLQHRFVYLPLLAKQTMPKIILFDLFTVTLLS